jgi:predicted nucleic acid-binding protein
MAPLEPSPLVVCDAGPLIHLDELECIDLLADFTEVCVPESVWREVQRHRPAALRRRSVYLNRVDVIPEPTEELAFVTRTYGLHVGEQEALRLLHQFPEAVLLTDDAAARFAASKLGFEVHGTIGILVRAWRRGQRTKRQVLKLLKAIPQHTTLYITTALLNTVIGQVEGGAP